MMWPRPTRASAPASVPQYIIPVPFDPRLISAIPVAVARAAMDSGVAQKPILNMDRLCPGALGPARSDRLDAAADLRTCAPPSAPCRLRRGRGRAGHARGRVLCEPAARHRLSARTRGADARNRETGRHRSRPSRHRTRQRPSVAPCRCLYRLSLCEAAAQRLPAPRLPAADQHRPQPFRRLHGGARRCRRHGDRRHPELLDRASGCPPLSSTSSPVTG
jgi:hypothetical protein